MKDILRGMGKGKFIIVINGLKKAEKRKKWQELIRHK